VVIEAVGVVAAEEAVEREVAPDSAGVPYVFFVAFPPTAAGVDACPLLKEAALGGGIAAGIEVLLLTAFATPSAADCGWPTPAFGGGVGINKVAAARD